MNFPFSNIWDQGAGAASNSANLVIVAVVVPVLVVLILSGVVVLICFKSKANKSNSKPKGLDAEQQQKQQELTDIVTTVVNVKQPNTVELIRDVQIGNPIGSGAFGNVYQANWKQAIVALKTLDDNAVKFFMQEVVILSELKQ